MMARISLDPPRTFRYRAMAWWSRRKFGRELDPGRAMGHHTGVTAAYASFELQVMRWNALPHRLKDLAVMAAAVRIGCQWCVDFGTWESSTRGIPLAELEAVPTWRDSDLFTEEERLVLEYAEAMTETPPAVTDELTEGLRRFLDERQIVELTMMVAVENLRSRFNAAAGLTGQGFKEQCSVRQGPARQGPARRGPVRKGPARAARDGERSVRG